MKTIALMLAILFAAILNRSKAQDTWLQRANFMGTARAAAVGFSIGSKGYVGTGIDKNSKQKKDFWQYDPANNTWAQKADVGGPGRFSAVGFSIGNKGYIGTGSDFQAEERDDFWEYDPENNTWEKKTDFGGIPRTKAVGFSIGNKGYIGTGGILDGDTNALTDFWEYDPDHDTWTQKKDFGGPERTIATAFSIGNKGYIGIGKGFLVTYSDFWEYDPSNDTWTQMADFMGTARSGAVGLSIDNKGYIGTGYDGSYQNDFWEYDPSNDTWTQKTNFGGTARSGAVGFSIGSKGYIGTGYGGTSKKDFWEYTPDISISISTGVIVGSPFCPEATVNVPFTSTGVFSNQNNYTAELSDMNGSFIPPTILASMNSSANSGTIIASLPSDPTAGSKYRIRVTSDNPVAIGTDNGTDLKLIACKKVTALSASGITSTSATLNWINASCVAKYKVQYREQNTDQWKSKYSNTNSYVLMNLMPNIPYEYRVQTFCTSDGSSKSNFTSIQTFTTSLRLATIPVYSEDRMSIYPNPAGNQTTIYFTTLQPSHVNVKVYDLNGKEMGILLNDEVEQGDHSLLLTTDHFSKGVYLVKIISDVGTEHEKLIVQ